MSLSFQDSNPADACETYLGFVSAGSLPPPAGSGTITFYSRTRAYYTATYNPTSFSLVMGSCTYNFGPQKINNADFDGLYRVVRADMKVLTQYGGTFCPMTGSCLRSFWVSASANGVVALVDQSASAGDDCPSLLAYVNGTLPSGTQILVIAGKAANQQMVWAPTGMFGGYDPTGSTISLIIDGCENDMVKAASIVGAIPFTSPEVPNSFPPAVVADFGVQLPASAPGSVVVAYVGVSPESCPANPCAASGLYVVWDKAGMPPYACVDNACGLHHDACLHSNMCTFVRRWYWLGAVASHQQQQRCFLTLDMQGKCPSRLGAPVPPTNAEPISGSPHLVRPLRPLAAATSPYTTTIRTRTWQRTHRLTSTSKWGAASTRPVSCPLYPLSEPFL